MLARTDVVVVLLYVASELSTVRRPDLEHETLENIVLEVRVEKRKLFLVLCIYRPQLSRSWYSLDCTGEMY